MSVMVKFEDQKQKQDLDYFKDLVQIANKSGNYKGLTPEMMLNVMLTAKDLGISPMKALNGGFYIVNGKISMSTALMADRIRKEGHSIKIPEWTSQKCVILGVRNDNGDSVKFEFTMEDAELAGLTKSPTWIKFPKQMLYNRAMSTLARTLFPDVIGCAYSEDEKYDVSNTPPEKRPVEDPDTITITEIKKLSQEQINSVLEIVGDRKEVLENILAWAKVPSLSEMPADTYDALITGLKKKYMSKVTVLHQEVE